MIGLPFQSVYLHWALLLLSQVMNIALWFTQKRRHQLVIDVPISHLLTSELLRPWERIEFKISSKLKYRLIYDSTASNANLVDSFEEARGFEEDLCLCLHSDS